VDDNSGPHSVFVESLLCGSDDAQGRLFRFQQSPAGYPLFAKGNYAAFVSPYHAEYQMVHRGAFIVGGQSLAKMSDGTSSTLAFGEVRTRDHLEDQRGAWALLAAGASMLAADFHHDHKAAGGFVAPYTPSKAYFAGSDNNNYVLVPNASTNPERTRVDRLSRCPEPDAAVSEGMPCAVEGAFATAAPRSQHNGGVNVTYVDGHVDFMTDDIDALLYAYLICIDDGYVTSGDRGVRPWEQ
jgi:prepilin-type processing-associated H-X9-DG protein